MAPRRGMLLVFVLCTANCRAPCSTLHKFGDAAPNCDRTGWPFEDHELFNCRPTLKKYSAAVLRTGISVRIVRRRRSDTLSSSSATSAKGSSFRSPSSAKLCKEMHDCNQSNVSRKRSVCVIVPSAGANCSLRGPLHHTRTSRCRAAVWQEAASP